DFGAHSPSPLSKERARGAHRLQALRERALPLQCEPRTPLEMEEDSSAMDLRRLLGGLPLWNFDDLGFKARVPPFHEENPLYGIRHRFGEVDRGTPPLSLLGLLSFHPHLPSDPGPVGAESLPQKELGFRGSERLEYRHPLHSGAHWLHDRPPPARF